MARPEAARVVSVLTAHTARVPDDVLASARGLMDAAFDDFEDDDWSHALGGEHAYVVVDGQVVAHGSLVRRHCYLGADLRPLRLGYVEAVAVHPDHQRRGLGSAVMAALEELAPAFDLLALGASDEGRAMYDARGWVPWRGTLHVLGPRGVERTAEEEGYVLVRAGALALVELDLDARLACDWREGDVW